MEVTREDRDEVVILRLDGRLIGEEEPGNITHAAVLELVEQGKNRVLIDLSSVAFINSTGLGILVANYVRLRRTDGMLKLFNPTGRVKALFDSVPQLFEIFYDEDRAVASFGA